MNSYYINGISLPMGITFNEAVALLSHVKQFAPHPAGWSNFHIEGGTVYGLHCPRVEIRAPFADRPVMQVIYQLSPVASNSNDLHSGFMHILEKQLGPPLKTKSYYDNNDWRKGLSQYGVAFTATWETEEVRISLSVYGGNRNDESGPHGAGLYVNWLNEIRAGEKHSVLLRRLSEQVSSQWPDAEHKHMITLHHSQNMFAIHHYENADPKEAEHNTELRSAQLALYRQDMFPTPSVISDAMTEKQVIIFHLPALQKTFISKKHDTIFIDKNEKPASTFFEVQPARGSGGRELIIKELLLHDAANSNALLDLVQWLERVAGVQTVMAERIDD